MSPASTSPSPRRSRWSSPITPLARCSTGRRSSSRPKRCCARAGFTVREPAESHLCCGSAGTYNILHPETAAALRARKASHLERLKPDVIAAGNIGCLTQIASATAIPVVHTVELLDWASGGPAPEGLG